MNAQTHFIIDRAQSLAYEARQFPATAQTAIAWLDRAMAWAEKSGLSECKRSLMATSLQLSGYESRSASQQPERQPATGAPASNQEYPARSFCILPGRKLKERAA